MQLLEKVAQKPKIYLLEKVAQKPNLSFRKSCAKFGFSKGRISSS